MERNVEPIIDSLHSFNLFEVERIVEDSFDLFKLRLIYDNIRTERSNEVKGVEIAEYTAILKLAKEHLEDINNMALTIAENNKKELFFKDFFKDSIEYLFKNHSNSNFEKGMISLTEDLIKEITATVEEYVYDYLEVFYHMVGKTYYYTGKASTILLQGIKQNEKSKGLFLSIVNSGEVLNNIDRAERSSHLPNIIERTILAMFEEFTNTNKELVNELFNTEEIRLNMDDIKYILGENFISVNIKENIKEIERRIGQLKNREVVFLNELKNEKLSNFVNNVSIFFNNLKTFIKYTEFSIEVCSKLLLKSFGNVIKGAIGEEIVIPDYIDINKDLSEIKTNLSEPSDKLYKSISSAIVKKYRKSNEYFLDLILMRSFKIVMKTLPLYKLAEMYSELFLSEKVVKKFFKSTLSFSEDLKKALSLIEDMDISIRSEIAEKGMQFEEEDIKEETSKPGSLDLQFALKSYDSKAFAKIKSNIEEMSNALGIAAITTKIPRKEDKVNYSETLYNELLSYKVIHLSKEEFKTTLDSMNLLLSYIKIAGDVPLVSMLKDRYMFFNTFKRIIERYTDDERNRVILTDELSKIYKDYLKDLKIEKYFSSLEEVIDIHNKDFLPMIQAINDNTVMSLSDKKRFLNKFNEATSFMKNKINYMTSVDVLTNILYSSKKSFDKIEELYIILVNELFFKVLL